MSKDYYPDHKRRSPSPTGMYRSSPPRQKLSRSDSFEDLKRQFHEIDSSIKLENLQYEQRGSTVNEYLENFAKS